MESKSCNHLLKVFNKTPKPTRAKKLVFNGFDGYDIYNPTAPFSYKGNTLIIGRVEKRDSEHSESVFFYKKKDGSYSEFLDLKRYKLQDPFISIINGFYVFGGTEIFPHPENKNNLWWQTKFYYGKNLSSLKELTTGPRGMKDIRLVELTNNKIGVFSRPQGKIGGRGKIGFTIINSLFDLNSDVINNAKLLDQFNDDEWGGANEAVVLSNGNIGVLGHMARYSHGDTRHYYPIVFQINPLTYEYSEIKIIAQRSNFVKGPSKRESLTDVLFSGGLVRQKNGKATLFVGVSDVEVQSALIVDPFSCYETE